MFLCNHSVDMLWLLNQLMRDSPEIQTHVNWYYLQGKLDIIQWGIQRMPFPKTSKNLF